jgi:beta-lactamase superfamily II metal-dependent hydrolase
MYDICGGNRPRESDLMKSLRVFTESRVLGNFAMCQHPWNPLDYLAKAGLSTVFRFILSHPDCDHIDGLDALFEDHALLNFWHTGVERDKPHFDGSPFREEDWDRYDHLRLGTQEGTKILSPLAGARFAYANKTETEDGGDGLYILAPDNGLVAAAQLTGDFNDASYVLLYRSVGGRIVLPGDAHDKTWEYVLQTQANEIKRVPLLIAPHHGRKSGRDYAFLDTLRPKLTLFGCAPSDALAYDAWRNRGLPIITNNQAGCVTVEISDSSMEVYVENHKYAEACGVNTSVTNSMGFVHMGTITEQS